MTDTDLIAACLLVLNDLCLLGDIKLESTSDKEALY